MAPQKSPCAIHGHRGARGLAPENTLASFQAACALGVDGLEFDVLISADERVVIHHDHQLNPSLCRDSAGVWLRPPTPKIRALSSAALKAYDVGRAQSDSEIAKRFPLQRPAEGAQIPLLEDLAGWWRTLTPFRPILNIELKSHPDFPDDTPPARDYVRIVLNEIKRFELTGYVWLQAFDWRLLIEVQAQAPEIPTGYLSSETDEEPTVYADVESPWLAGFDPFRFHSDLAGAIKEAKGAYWGPWIGDLSQEKVQHARSLGLGVHPWTLNHNDDFEKALAWGVSGVTTDYPDRARAVFSENSVVIPRPCISHRTNV